MRGGRGEGCVNGAGLRRYTQRRECLRIQTRVILSEAKNPAMWRVLRSQGNHCGAGVSPGVTLPRPKPGGSGLTVALRGVEFSR